MADPFETTAVMGPEQGQVDQSSSELSVLSRTPSPLYPPSRMQESSDSESNSKVEEVSFPRTNQRSIANGIQAFRKLAVEDKTVPFSFDDEYAKVSSCPLSGIGNG